MNDAEHPLARNLAYVERASVADLTSSILRAACLQPDEHLLVVTEPEFPSQFYALYDSAPTLVLQEKLKAALLAALVEWKPGWHGYPALRELVLAAAYIRATGVVDVLRRVIFAEDVRPSKKNVRDTFEVVFGVLGGFAPLPSVRDALERAQNDERYDKHFAAQIFNGLCYCTPDLYPAHLKKFLSAAAGSNYYVVDEVIAEMIRLIGTEAVTRNMSELDPWASRLVSAVLFRTEHTPRVEGELGYVDKTGRAFPIESAHDFSAVLGMTTGFVDHCKQKFGSLHGYLRNRVARVAT